ncbi:hypothetical protein [Methanoregula sp. UBA64]|jgi:hypothetical protein|uniref:hypothetical protein n=1 Tax=Methanoregula sp. UBA64 TaxID=1915554 RepID=UPI0025EEF12F|nr:hypothetical protein [Methanoregula sp. UBA64]
MIEYVIVSGILLLLFMVMLLMVNANFMQGPSETLQYTAFTDIGNGISTRIVDIYSIAPTNGTISTAFDIPDEVAQQDYTVEIHQGATAADQYARVYRGIIASNISLGGISATRSVSGNTTGQGMNRIRYDSTGFGT